MSELLNSPGLCNRACDLDGYVRTVRDTGVFDQLIDSDVVSGADAAVRYVFQIQSEIVDESKRQAAAKPCEGYLETGVVTADVEVHCPVVLRALTALALGN